MTRRSFEKYPNKVLVESGTYCGDGIQDGLNNGFSKILSYEVSKLYYDKSIERFKNNPNVVIFNKPSQNMYEDIKTIDEPMTFWLDGHYSGGDTSFSNIYCPLLEEIEQISKHHIKTHTILIDDVRCFGTEAFQFLQKETIIKKILEINPNYKFKYEHGHIENDILVAYVENILVMFRGSNTRGDYSNEQIVNNIKKNVLDPLREKYNVDVYFSTYNEQCLEYYTIMLGCKGSFLMDRLPYEIGQISNFKFCLENIKNLQKKYSKILILRFDVYYLVNIKNWNIWNNHGIHLTYKEELWNSHKYCGDLIFVIDGMEMFDIFYKAFLNEYKVYLGIHKIMHFMSAALLNIGYDKFNFMVDGYYTIYTNPIARVQRMTNDIYHNPSISNYCD